MIASLGCSTQDTGIYFPGDASSHGEYLALSRMEIGGSIGADAISRTLRDIDLLAKCSDPDDTPTDHAREQAKLLLAEAQTIRPIFLMASTIEASERDVLVHWDTLEKSVVLVAPSVQSKPAQIYTEVLDGKKAITSTISDASGSALSTALAWVLQH
jgi:hypothetical protein